MGTTDEKSKILNFNIIVIEKIRDFSLCILPDSLPGGWVPTTNTESEWVGVNFGFTMLVKGVSTQGCPAENSWVKTYSVRYTYAELDFFYYIMDGSNIKVIS